MATATAAAAAARAPAAVDVRSPWRDAWRRLRKNRMAVAMGAIFLAICAFCFLGPIVAGWFGLDATTIRIDRGATAPSWAHPFGTDLLGRDMLVRTMIGGRIAILVAFTATAIALVIGVTWGAIAAYAGGRVDYVMMRVVDALYGFPTVVFVIVVMAVFDTKSIVVLFALIGGISWLNMARQTRGQVLSLRHREFVEAARAVGARPGRILFRHIVPNALGVIIVAATASLPSVMLTEAFLSFLGLGVQAPMASWGTLVSEGSTQISVYVWVLVAPGVVMGLTIMALNFLGDGLRDALDPQTRKD
ncbi:MAG: ABC transporter permease [Kofleriaceae bacterium]|nr:ABC transporter permease [Kofleriaceae bacterium]MCL4227644.1 ABC transporter permease [Myxococcales bacterium]